MNGLMAHANRIMSKAKFDPDKIKLSVIWAAKRNPCLTCGADPFTPCINLTRRKQGVEVATKWPHEQRVDYQLLISTLHQRGYY